MEVHSEIGEKLICLVLLLPAFLRPLGAADCHLRIDVVLLDHLTLEATHVQKVGLPRPDYSSPWLLLVLVVVLALRDLLLLKAKGELDGRTLVVILEVDSAHEIVGKLI